MNPYLTPTTMPDGSTRRPIVERVPETMPEHVVTPSIDGSVFCYIKGIPVMSDAERQIVQRILGIPEQADDGDKALWQPECLVVPGIALALCRVAVEDWLIEIGSKKTTIGERLFLGRFTRILGGGGYKAAMNIAPCTEFSDGHTTQEAESTSIHAALNAAAHAVADALGVAP